MVDEVAVGAGTPWVLRSRHWIHGDAQRLVKIRCVGMRGVATKIVELNRGASGEGSESDDGLDAKRL